ncbi:1-deoxy-D-xylulose-5-phosphate synthase [Desulfovibrio sp. OttesenSCG-928-G11]|nr:1-deoxy-D-xylulose-5-phosphate synthase [Desulfovibrio sp. OttesenSCG-928-G11]
MTHSSEMPGAGLPLSEFGLGQSLAAPAPPLAASADGAAALHIPGAPGAGGLLAGISHPAQTASLSLPELEELASEIRRKLVSSVSVTGGHLAPSLGVVELTLALLSVFNPEKDKLVWDVGHQAYAYKMLTGRSRLFHTLRRLGGISGFPSRAESPFDHFGVGHSSTSISAALGMAKARDLAGEDHHVVSIIGDGSLTGGMAYEAMNQAGATAGRFIVILNDNEMSISRNVGALSLFMSRNLSARWVRRVKREVEGFLTAIPGIGGDLAEIARRSKHSFKNFFTPGMLFEALRFNYIGAVDGHNIEELQKNLQLAASLDRPVLVHVLTRKGKGYAPAEANPVLFHGVGAFEPESGSCVAPAADCLSYTEAFGRGICDLAEKDERVIAITAAMPEGTGLTDFAGRFPERFIDVGICEQHAVTMAAGLATRGFKPFVAVYSTFLQRAYDQIVHDVCLQKLPVTFCIDRAGIVGEDGATHQGAFDLAYLRHIPGMTIFAPKDEAELLHGLATALAHDGPFALRWPRGLGAGAALPEKPQPLPPGRAELLMRGNGELAVLALGNRVLPALYAARSIKEDGGPAVTVINARWVKPLPEEDLRAAAGDHKKLLLLEEGSLAGGFSSAVLEFLNDQGLLASLTVQRLGLPDAFIEHGPAKALRKNLALDSASIERRMRELLCLDCTSSLPL